MGRIYCFKKGERNGLKLGEQKGLKIGERKSLLKTIQNMLKNNFTLEDISKVTELSIAEIEKLQKEKF